MSFAVDLYAGPGGWEEGMRTIGITDVIGIEIEPNACATAEAAGHKRVQGDVSAVPIADYNGAWGLVASPPCQAWSMAGKRQGELDRAKVHALIDAYAAGSDTVGDGWADPRSHHAAQPVRWVRDLRPEWVCFEQVPAVLGLWQHASDVLRRWGYSTWTGVLNSADYGVPQTRERAVLIARRAGPAAPPKPTHTRLPEGVDLFGGELQPWVSMADALGWGMTGRPSMTVTGGGAATGGAEPFGNAARQGMRAEQSAGHWADHGVSLDRRTNSRGPRGTSVPVAPVPTDRPAPTITATANAAWTSTRPATTIACDPRVSPPGHRDRAGGERQHEHSLRISVAEAALLQSFRADYPWQGTKTAQFLQVGNAVPPRLAAAIVAAATGSDLVTTHTTRSVSGT